MLAVVIFSVAACGQATRTPSAPPTVTSPVTGIVTAIDSQSLGDVKGFTLRTPDGQQLNFAIGTLENGASFPPGHLAEHQVTAEPVRVYFRQEAGGLVVYRIEDAGARAGSASPSASAS